MIQPDPFHRRRLTSFDLSSTSSSIAVPAVSATAACCSTLFNISKLHTCHKGL